MNIIAIANYKGTQEEGPYFPVVTLFTLDVVNNVYSPAGTIEDNNVVQAIFAKDAQVEVEVSGDGSKVAIAQVYTNRLKGGQKGRQEGRCKRRRKKARNGDCRQRGTDGSKEGSQEGKGR